MMMGVFRFVSAICVAFVFLAITSSVEGSHRIYPEYQSLQANNVKLVHRTGFHFQPPKHWINDPNGPMYYNGLYHLFYQYNPKGAVWGNIVWAHSVSKDLINWEALEPAIYPSEWFDINGCWSGSATILPGNKPVILYTGIDPKQRQIQNYAIPKNLSDPYLREWVKPKDNPVVDPDSKVNASAFRDPTTAWYADGHWRILVGSKRKHRGIAYLYRSKNFKKWVKAEHPLHSKAKTGMWECPDFFPVSLSGENGLDTSVINQNVKHVLKVSLDLTRYEYYTLGTYDKRKDRYYPDSNLVDGWGGLRYDYGNFYASKTFFDPSKNRRILWGWANESDAIQDDKNKGWAGIQLIPRKLWLDPSGNQLIQWPIEELESLRGQSVQLTSKQIKKGEHVEVKGITAAQADVDVTFSFASLDKAEPFDPKWENLVAQDVCAAKGSKAQGGLGPFGLLTLASENLEEFNPVFFRVFKASDKYKVLLCSDARSSSLGSGLYKPSFSGFVDVDLADKKLSLRSLIDHSVVESFGAKGKTVVTSRVYPTIAVFDKAHLFVFNNGSETVTVETLKAWRMNKPVMNSPVRK
ncbi:beta-fructofuranosidase, insoluble isoenzyme 3 [Ricinus communis]|uniref:Beta-fructofuranosidase, insoluble isoenzyme 3, putative n=1 Tax=Ricinus communis TaxID=3988 RepID=B9SWG8_RICCO|nr:beta-fructofuranosidase, insoluble isoenzyme 3 [Ricinus communis]EEF32053.1 Beta-fructofuranosidase, insoluble isoenzyme 3 precursor, putative [Ricinus communis]|eukprot:XP_002530337.1 beta-fructofuranosidase, insoluble isoenzyme 3 [Ricinus communis]